MSSDFLSACQLIYIYIYFFFLKVSKTHCSDLFFLKKNKLVFTNIKYPGSCKTCSVITFGKILQMLFSPIYTYFIIIVAESFPENTDNT